MFLSARLDQLLGERIADDGEGPAFAVGPGGVLGADAAVERAGDRQLAKVGGAFGPDHAVLEAGDVRRLGQVWNRAHAGAVAAERHHLTRRQVLHAIRVGIGPGGGLAVERIGNEAAAGGERLVILVGVAAMKEHHVAGTERADFLLPGHHLFALDQVAAALWGGIEQVLAVDDAGLAAELPGRHLLAEHAAEAPRVGQLGVGKRDRVRWEVELGAGVAVDAEDVAVIRAGRPDAAIVIDLEHGKVVVRPGTRVILCDQQR